MKQLTTLSVITATLLLVACGKKDAPVASSNPAPAATTAPAAQAPTATTPVASSIPADCDTYLKQMEACAPKMGAAGDALKPAIQQIRASFANANPDALKAAAESCTQMASSFKEAAAMFKC